MHAEFDIVGSFLSVEIFRSYIREKSIYKWGLWVLNRWELFAMWEGSREEKGPTTNSLALVNPSPPPALNIKLALRGLVITRSQLTPDIILLTFRTSEDYSRLFSMHFSRGSGGCWRKLGGERLGNEERSVSGKDRRLVSQALRLH